MSQASHIDLDFDAITQALTVNVLWEAPNTSRNTLVARRARPIRKLRNEDRVEVGIFHREGSTEPEEMSFGGFLTVIGQDDNPSMSDSYD